MPPQTAPLTLAQNSTSAGDIFAQVEAPGGPKALAKSLYIHIPFCFHKCHYCDFYSFVDSQDRQGAFVEALIKELRALAPWADGLDTIFVGGGTPTLLAPELWSRLLEALHEVYTLAPNAEFTVECNPETATPELMRSLHTGGVNRISIGAQSFDPAHLKTLERWHEPANVAKALDIAASAGITRRSIDLIFSIPSQTLDDWKRDLDRAIALGIEHLSCYALTYEPNTAMTKRLERGDFTRTDESLEADMYETTVAQLADAGLKRYEVSNFAREGCECRHNMAYWRQEPWLAAGPSGSAHMGGYRWKNVPRLTDWMDAVNAGPGFSPAVDVEAPDPRRALAERLMTAVRVREGFEHVAIMQRARKLGVDQSLERTIDKHIALTRLDKQAGPPGARTIIAPTNLGFLFADEVAADLIESAS